jgi:hypothetical protein
MTHRFEIERIGELSPDAQDLLFARLRKRAPAEAGERIVRRADRGETAPLSFAQERLWFLDQMRPGDPAYGISTALRLSGPLAVAVLARSLEEIVRRHEALRTTFRILEDRPLQVVEPSFQVPLSVIDLERLAPDERERQVRELAWRASRFRFDLERGPLLRACLLRLAPTEHVLLLDLHHIVSDGWSMGVLVQEAAALYRELSAGRPSPLPELPFQYADFALWQRNWLSGDRLTRLVDEWRRRLTGLTFMELPLDHPRPAVQTSNGGLISFSVPAPVTAGLRRIAEESGATLFMTLLATFATLLYRYTGQTDVAVGFPIANRNRAEIEGLIGLFMNVVILRGDLAGDPVWRDLLQRVANVALEAYAHQDLPFERLVEELQPERSLSHNPLVNVLLILQNAPLELRLGPDLSLAPLDLHNGTAKLDLSLTLLEGPGGLAGALEYSRDLFEPATVERLAGHFVNLLGAVVAEPGTRISDLPLLAGSERDQLLRAARDTRTSYRSEALLHQLFEEAAVANPQGTALICGPLRLTWAELDARANQIAHHLRAQGAGPESLVGVCLERSADLVAALLGILKAGAAYVPLDPLYPAERLSLMTEDARIPLLLRAAGSPGNLQLPGLRVLGLEAESSAIDRRSRQSLEVAGHPDQLA